MKTNDVVLNDLLHKFHPIEANEKIPDNCRYPLANIHAAQNKKQIPMLLT